LSDETDYYPPLQQTEVRAVMEGYIGKPNSDPTIVMVSTPKAPGGLMQQIEQEPDSLYHKLFFDYTYGRQGPYPIYSREQTEKAKSSPSFEREYNLKYQGLIGNVFHTKDIDAAIEEGRLYDHIIYIYKNFRSYSLSIIYPGKALRLTLYKLNRREDY
jgi:hypothetical protein